MKLNTLADHLVMSGLKNVKTEFILCISVKIKMDLDSNRWFSVGLFTFSFIPVRHFKCASVSFCHYLTTWLKSHHKGC